MKPFLPDEAVEQVRQGDVNAFEAIINAYDVDVRVVLGAMLPKRSLVEDAAQETFITAYHKLDKYQLGTDLRSWIKAIARNTARNMRRQWIRRERLLNSYQDEIHCTLDDMVVVQADSLVDDVSQKLKECITRLKKNAQEVVKMHYEAGKSCKEIAAALTQTTGSVKVTLSRARIALGHCLRAKGGMSHG